MTASAAEFRERLEHAAAVFRAQVALPAPASGAPQSRPTPRSATDKQRRFDTIALVLQGGGALGSYQAGVIEALMEAGIEPNWVTGISIGALNSAIMAGNPPETRLERLRGFWNTICRPAIPFLSADALRGAIDLGGVQARRLFSGFEAARVMMEGANGFFTPRGWLPWLGLPQNASDVGFYDTSQLKSTLERFVDFDRINAGPMRVSVAAVDVQTGNFVFFDNSRGNTKGRLRAEHFMASGALPPGFPAIEIDGRYYWDGGLMSNTPLSEVLDAEPRRNTLAFQVDLWSTTGPLPQNIYDAEERMKDIQFSSRTRYITTQMRRQQNDRRLLRELLELIPPEQRATNRWCRQAEQKACSRQYAVIHLIYRRKEWEGSVKDYEFSELTMLDHWRSGLEDARSALSHKDWLVPVPDGHEFITYDDGRAIKARG